MVWAATAVGATEFAVVAVLAVVEAVATVAGIAAVEAVVSGVVLMAGVEVTPEPPSELMHALVPVLAPAPAPEFTAPVRDGFLVTGESLAAGKFAASRESPTSCESTSSSKLSSFAPFVVRVFLPLVERVNDSAQRIRQRLELVGAQRFLCCGVDLLTS